MQLTLDGTTESSLSIDLGKVDAITVDPEFIFRPFVATLQLFGVTSLGAEDFDKG